MYSNTWNVTGWLTVSQQDFVICLKGNIPNYKLSTWGNRYVITTWIFYNLLMVPFSMYLDDITNLKVTFYRHWKIDGCFLNTRHPFFVVCRHKCDTFSWRSVNFAPNNWHVKMKYFSIFLKIIIYLNYRLEMKMSKNYEIYY